jgi:uncharacterized protein YhjY with autotransporter beta-barrel domain/V8-like Glu-specific endopeptidase
MKLSRTRRLVFGASAAAIAASFSAAPAAAQIADESIGSATPSLRNLVDVSDVQREAQNSQYYRYGELLPQDRPNVSTTELTPQIVIAGPETPTTARDPNNVTGVGQMIVDEQNGFIGLCTGTLINPRTVIFAAHCVNERPASAYGQDSGGQPIGFGFSNNNNQAGNSAFGNWLANYQTNTARFMYDVNYVAYNPLSLQPAAVGFLYGDVAVASLDAPAANVPTWALLFSALPATPITAAGTGYHVTIDGYGNNGTGTTGSTGGIDFRRRIAENTLGALASLDDFEGFLFGTGPEGLPQNLYWIDFDDPRRGTPQASPFDFNAWRDNALPKEGITASGDSGGPLILDRTFARAVVIGVLSGGYTRFFNGQPANGYGTAAFYQPLYLYWDWVAANNPYHYVSSLAGNANWTDPTHWVTNLDPAYQIIGPNGQLVNGIPNSPGAGNTDQPGFGQACFQSGGVSDCYDVATGQEKIENKPIGTGDTTTGPTMVSTEQLGVANDRGTGTAAGLGGAPADQGSGTGSVTQNTQTATGGPADALPPATLGNGLPGASNFVPNNFDGNRLTSTAPRYFDVTLAATGTTTLNTAVTIDRLTLAGIGAGLDITSTGSLTSLIGVTQGTGTMQVNGTLTTPGDYLMISGGLNGTGTITTPFFTSMAGTIAPGTYGTIGTLNFRGNVILASANLLLVDLGPNGISDRLAVAATTFGANNVPTNGIANIGGFVAFGLAPGNGVRAGNVYTILTAQGGVTGTFSGTAPISAILSPVFIYRPTSVDVQIQAGLYANVVDPNSAVQRSYASLLDTSRNSSNPLLADLYGPLDLQTQGGIRAFLEGIAPRFETLRTAIAVAETENMSRFYRQRIDEITPGEATGQLAMMGQPLQFAQASATYGAAAAIESDANANMVQTNAVPLPENMSGYITAGYVDGNSRPMPAAASAGRDQFNGWFAAIGLERELGGHATGGFSISYTDLDGQTGGAPQQVSGQLWQGTLYAAARTRQGLRLDGQLSAGQLQTRTRRGVALGNTIYDLRSNGSALAFSAEGGIGYDVSKGAAFSITPRASLRYGLVDFSRTQESGGPMALVIQNRNSESLEARAGISLAGHTGRFRPHLSANYVHDFLDRPSTFGGSFIGSPAFAPFALASTDKDWGEISGGFSFMAGGVEIGFDADTTVARDDVRNQSYRGRIGVRF